jgi:hypothetical protein
MPIHRSRGNVQPQGGHIVDRQRRLLRRPDESADDPTGIVGRLTDRIGRTRLRRPRRLRLPLGGTGSRHALDALHLLARIAVGSDATRDQPIRIRHFAVRVAKIIPSNVTSN